MTVRDIVNNCNIKFENKFNIYKGKPGQKWQKCEIVWFAGDKEFMPSDSILNAPVISIAVTCNNTLILVIPEDTTK